MNRIAYIELDTHAEIAANFMALMQDSEEFSVDYFFSDRILDHLNLQSGKAIFRSTAATLLSQISAQDYDLVIIGTVHRYFNVFQRVTKRFPTAVIVHNINFSVAKPYQLFKNIFKTETAYRLKLLLNEGLLKAPKVYSQAKFRLVLDKTMAENDYIYFPIFYKTEFTRPRDSIATVVIPGTVAQSRRDYRHVFSKMAEFHSKTHLRLVLLGKMSSKLKNTAENFIRSKKKNQQLIYFDEKVHADEFAFYMQSADMLWCPIQKKTEFFSIEEIYGQTKMSGNIGDAIKYEKMAIFPKWFDSAYGFTVPEAENVEKQILTLRKNYTFDFSDYSMKRIEQKLATVLRQLTEKT